MELSGGHESLTKKEAREEEEVEEEEDEEEEELSLRYLLALPPSECEIDIGQHGSFHFREAKATSAGVLARTASPNLHFLGQEADETIRDVVAIGALHASASVRV